MRVGRSLGAAFLSLLAVSCGPAGPRITGGELTLIGSETALRAVQAGADSFIATYPKARIRVEGGGAVVGLEALLNHEADAAVLCRDPLEEERAAARKLKVELALYPFARDGLAIIVHRSNRVYALSFDEVRAVFSGRTQDWGDLGGEPGRILVYLSGVQSGARGFVQKMVLDGAPFVEGAGRGPTTEAVVDSVAAHEDAIGYAGMTEVDDRVKALPISSPDGGPLIVLNVDTVYRREYPLVRTFFFGTRGIPRDNLASGFISFMMSTSGQRIVLESGLIPATVPLRIRHEG